MHYANSSSLAPVRPADLPLERILSEVIDAEFVRRNRVLPLSLKNGLISLGVNRSAQLRACSCDRLSYRPHCRSADFYVRGFREGVRYALCRACPSAGRIDRGGEASETDVQRLRDIASEAPVIRLVNQIITDAVELRASDIHIEPNAEQVLVRYRVDGMLRAAQSMTPSLRAAITSRLKIMSKMDIAERRMPQDGRIKVAVRGIDIDFRVSTIPTMFGESIVLRILDRTRVTLDFPELGFSSIRSPRSRSCCGSPTELLS